MFTAAWRFFRKNLKRNIAISVVLFGGVAFAGIEWTATPRFCGKTCHIMDTYYVSWEKSTHKQVACVECHIPPGMQSYVEAKLNGLGQVVDDLLNRTTMKPSASINDAACLRSGCHVRENLPELGQTEKRPYKFNHAKHLDFNYKGIPLHCSTCHSHVKGENHFEVNTNICVNCHLLEPQPATAASKVAEATAGHGEAGSGGATVASGLFTAALAAAGDEGASGHAGAGTASGATPSKGPSKELAAPTDCTTCHDPPLKPFKYQGLTIDHAEYLRFGTSCGSCHKNVTLQPQPVPNGQCYECHEFGRERFTTVDEMHALHAEGKHKVECFSCHGVIQHGPQAQITSMQEFDCLKCHTGQHQVQRSSYATPHSEGEPGTEDDPVSPMFLVHVDCTGCHTQASPVSSNPTSGATVNKATPEACDACHQPGFGKQLVPNWQKSTHAMYDLIEALLPSDAKPWNNGPPAPGSDAAKLLDEAKRLLDLVRVDGSWGVHNPRYTEQLLEQAREKIMKAKAMPRTASASPASATNVGAATP